MYNPASLVLYDAKLPIYKYGINCKLAVSIRSSLGVFRSKIPVVLCDVCQMSNSGNHPPKSWRGEWIP